MIKAIQLAKSGAYEDALKICRKIKLDNTNSAVYYNLTGILCRRLGLLDEALSNSNRAIQIDRNFKIPKKLN